MKKQLKNNIVHDIKGDGNPPLRVRVRPNVPSEVQSHTFEETSQTEGYLLDAVPYQPTASAQNLPTQALWYVIRCTYGRERKAYDYFKKRGFEAFCPSITSIVSADDGSKKVVERRLSNILFVYGSFEQLKLHVNNNVSSDTIYLRFYYNQLVDGTKSPMTVPNAQIESLLKIYNVQAEDNQIEPYVVEKFKKGKFVKVIDGPYKGVEGVVGRYKGQQRIGIVVEDLFTVTTSYVRKDFINYEEDFY